MPFERKGYWEGKSRRDKTWTPKGKSSGGASKAGTYIAVALVALPATVAVVVMGWIIVGNGWI